MEERSDIMSVFDYDQNFQVIMKGLLERAMQHSFDALMITKAERGYPIVFVNEAFTKLTGYGADEVVGKTPTILQGPKTDRAVLGRLREDLSAGRLFHGEAINYRKDGSEFLMEWKIVPIKDEKEEISHFLAIQRDVSKLTGRV